MGNLPPACTVVIKITYVAELPVEDGAIVFRLPGAVAPVQAAAATAVRGLVGPPQSRTGQARLTSWIAGRARARS